MSLTRIVVAEPDEQYILPLERKFIEEFGDKAEINIITDIDYLHMFFSKPQNIDVLVINENIYESSFHKHNIQNVFMLSENETEENLTADLDINRIYKYTSVKEIFNTIVNNMTASVTENTVQKKQTKIITVYSPIGGAGKTTIATGIASALAKAYKKVLVVGIDSLQGYSYYIEKPTYLNNSVEKMIKNENEHIFNSLKAYILSEFVDFMPPFMSLCSLNLSASNYAYLINSIAESASYDYIIIDTSSEFSEIITKLMGISTNVIIALEQDKYSSYKFNCLLNSIDCSDTNKFIFVCNKYESDQENYLVKDDVINKFSISEYISFKNEIPQLSLKEISDVKSYQKIAYMFL